MATVRCPSCERVLEVEGAYRDWTVRCPHCAAEFVPNEAGAGRPRRRRRPRREEPAAFPDEEARGEYRRSARAEARQIVSGPAIGLEVVGWLSALASMCVCVLLLVLAIAVINDPNADEEDALVFVIFGALAGALGVPYSVAMIIGARKMRDLSSRGWAMTAAILGIATFGILGVIFGAWALVALENPAVRAAYGLDSIWRPRSPLRRKFE